MTGVAAAGPGMAAPAPPGAGGHASRDSFFFVNERPLRGSCRGGTDPAIPWRRTHDAQVHGPCIRRTHRNPAQDGGRRLQQRGDDAPLRLQGPHLSRKPGRRGHPGNEDPSRPGRHPRACRSCRHLRRPRPGGGGLRRLHPGRHPARDRHQPGLRRRRRTRPPPPGPARGARPRKRRARHGPQHAGGGQQLPAVQHGLHRHPLPRTVPSRVARRADGRSPGGVPQSLLARHRQGHRRGERLRPRYRRRPGLPRGRPGNEGDRRPHGRPQARPRISGIGRPGEPPQARHRDQDGPERRGGEGRAVPFGLAGRRGRRLRRRLRARRRPPCPHGGPDARCHPRPCRSRRNGGPAARRCHRHRGGRHHGRGHRRRARARFRKMPADLRESSGPDYPTGST